MKYLVDANLLSEPTKPSPDLRVVDWLRANEPDIAVDPVILGELRFGILILPQGKKRTALERWFDAGVGRLHCLPWDADTGLKWAELLTRLAASETREEREAGNCNLQLFLQIRKLKIRGMS